MNTAIQQQDHQFYLDKLPPEATRVAILKNGKRKWVELADLQPSDFLVINPKNQTPHYMAGNPGRPTAPPVKVHNPLMVALKKEKERNIKADGILRAVQADPNSEDVMFLVMEGLAEEIACLKHEREKADLEGSAKGSVGISERRIKALKMIGETWIKRMDQIQNRDIDLNSTTFRLLFEFIMQTFREAMSKSGIKAELVDVVFANLAKRLETGWEAEARNVMRKK